MMIKKCSNCYWCQMLKQHIGCYADGKWQKWLKHKSLNVPNDCPDWKKGLPDLPF